MAGQPTATKVRKDAYVGLKVSPQMKEDIERFAFNHGISSSSLVRRYIEEGIRRTKKELGIAQDSSND